MRTVCINYAWPLFIVFIAGLAAGTLLYVTFFEVLDRDKLGKSGMTGLLGWFLLATGFGLMAAFEAVGKFGENLNNSALMSMQFK